MQNEAFHNEVMYLLMLHILRIMVQNGQLTRLEYLRAERIMAKMYHPKTGRIFSDLSLT